MGESRKKSGWKLWAGIAALAGILCLSATMPAKAGTAINSIRLGSHPEYTRLVFDSTGDRPAKIEAPSAEGLTIRYGEVKAGNVLPKKYEARNSLVSAIALKNGSEIFISFRNPGAAVKTTVLQGSPPRAGHYRLILDFSSTPGSQAQQPAATPPRADGKEGEKSRKADPKGSRGAKSQNSAAVTPPASDGKTPSASDDAGAGPLFETADGYYSDHEQTMAQDGPQILEYYAAAVKAAPRHPNAPRAIFRSGMVSLALENPNKAEKFFQQVISDWPGNPLAFQCWVNLGKIFHQREAHIEAIEAFRSALRVSVPKSEKTEAVYNLGKEFSIVGAHKEAIESLNQCLTDDPGFYLKRPDLFKYLGESTFTLQQYDKSRDLLMRYLNLQKEYPDRDLVLAKVAEIFLHQGDQGLANRLYNYIQNHYPDSEGDYISKLRKAEIIEKRERGGPAGALVIYETLAGKKLPPALARLVSFKLASAEWKRGNSERSLELLEQALKNKMDANSQNEFKALRDKVALDFFKKSYADNNHSQVIQLYERYTPLIQSQQSQELEVQAAESYGTLKLFPSAVRIYERLLSGTKKKNEDWLLKTAQYCFQMGDMDKAAQYGRLIQSEALEPQKALLLGRICFRQEKYPDTIKTLSKLVLKQDATPAGMEPLVLYVKSQIELKKYDEAIPLAQKAVERLGEGDPEMRLQIGLLLNKCYQETKQPQKAIELMDSLLAIASSENQKDPLRYEMAKLYLGMGQKDKASEKLNELLQSTQSLWKVVAQQQLDSMQMARP
ncbi:MAG: tetratricopeptide repeat protein [Desulfobacteraceae bacterium]|nr:tetratricopeptide repeat protein [Desulfobacteraceae bacterium]